MNYKTIRTPNDGEGSMGNVILGTLIAAGILWLLTRDSMPRKEWPCK